jgi:Zn ribbon nucleic-acid-binding protein
MARATATARSLGLTCPFCGASDSDVTLNLNDLERIECADCSAEFTPQQALDRAAELVARWEAVVAWVRRAPVASA